MTGQLGTCAIAHCAEEPVEGSIFCGSLGQRHLADHWAGRTSELPDGTWILTAGPQPRAPQPRWLARQADPDAEGNTMNTLGRDETGFAARSAA